MILNVLLAMLRTDLQDLKAKVQNGTYGPAVRRYVRDLAGEIAVVPEWRWTDAQSRVWWLLDLQVTEDDKPFFVWLENNYPNTTIIGIWEYETGIPYGMTRNNGQLQGTPLRPYRRTIHMRFVSKRRTYDANGNVTSAVARTEPVDDHRWLGQAERIYT